MGTFDERVARAFPGDTISKRLAGTSADLGRVPRYVAEYILAQMTAKHGGSEAAGLHDAEEFLHTFSPRTEDTTMLRHCLTTARELQVLDLLSVEVDVATGHHWASVRCLGSERLRIDPALAGRHRGTMYGGQWGMCSIAYRPGDPDGDIGGKAYPAVVTAFVPVQTSPSDIERFRSARAEFTTDEWADLLVTSAGLNPVHLGAGELGWRRRLLFLTRLVPLVERNVNLVELGPKQTGKTFTLRNSSPHAFVLSGGRSTPANLFVNLRTGQPGIIGMKKAVVFDEVGRVQLGDQDATVSILKDYMQSGQFARGRDTYTSDAGIVFVGNIEMDGATPSAGYPHLFQALAPALQDTALLDRVHGFLPGWEMPKIGTDSIASTVGLISDYLAEMMNLLREESFESVYQRVVGNRAYCDGMTGRDETAVARVARGLLKLMFPGGDISDTGRADSVLLLAAEMRQRVHNQLVVMDPGEFRPRRIGFEGLEGEEPADFQMARRRGLSRHDAKLNVRPDVGEITGLVVVLNRLNEVVGGDVQIIEASTFAGSVGLEIIGTYDRSMKDSARAAYNYVRNNARELHIRPDALRERHISIHMLSVATPRQGPSAGLAFVIAIISALSGYPVVPALAVTGEVSMHGKVTAVGGIPQKITGAKIHGRKRVILPRENQRDLAAMDPADRDGLEIVLVDTVVEALSHAIQPSLREPAGSDPRSVIDTA